MTGVAADLKPLVMSCLDSNSQKRPPVAQVSIAIKRLKDVCSEKNSRDGMSPIVWWAEVSSEQQSKIILSYYTRQMMILWNNPEQAGHCIYFTCSRYKATIALMTVLFAIHGISLKGEFLWFSPFGLLL